MPIQQNQYWLILCPSKRLECAAAYVAHPPGRLWSYFSHFATPLTEAMRQARYSSRKILRALPFLRDSSQLFAVVKHHTSFACNGTPSVCMRLSQWLLIFAGNPNHSPKSRKLLWQCLKILKKINNHNLYWRGQKRATILNVHYTRYIFV